MNRSAYVESFAALLPQALAGRSGTRQWEEGQRGPRDVRRDQVLDKPYVNFGKLSLPDRLSFATAALILSRTEIGDKETTGITLGISAGSLSTDLRYMESLAAGFPSPALFSATLPSSAIADIAIYFGIKGPNRVIAGNGASGLIALEQAFSMLEMGKATAALWVCVNAVDLQDASCPLLGGTSDPLCSAFALLLSPRPGKQGCGMRLSASFSGRRRADG